MMLIHLEEIYVDKGQVTHFDSMQHLTHLKDYIPDCILGLINIFAYLIYECAHVGGLTLFICYH